MDVRMWLGQNRRDVIDRWLHTLSSQDLASLRALCKEEELDSLYQALVDAASSTGNGENGGLVSWAERCWQQRGLSPREWFRIALGLRRAVEETVCTSGDAQQALERWRAFAPRLDQVMEHLFGAYTQAADRALQRAYQQRDHLDRALSTAQEEADRTLAHLQSVYEISRALATSISDVERIFDELVQKLGGALQAQHCALWLDNLGGLYRVAVHGKGKALLPTFVQQDRDSSLALSLQTGQSLVLRRSTASRPGDKELMSGFGIHALLVAPLAVQDVPIGIVTLGRENGAGTFDPAEVALVESIISQAAIAMQNAGLYDEIRTLNRSLEGRVASRTRELEKEKKRFETLYALGRELNATLDMDYVLKRTLDLVTQTVGARRGSIMLLDLETGNLIHRARFGGRGPLPPGGEMTPFRSGYGLAGWVMEHREPVLLHDVQQDERWVSDEGTDPLIRSVIAAPLTSGDDVHGVLLVLDNEPHAFDEAQLELAVASAQQVAQAVSNAQLYEYVLDSADKLGHLLRREQEERSKSQAVLQSIADGVIVNDTRSQVIVFNTAAEEILDARREDVLGRDVRQLFQAFEEGGRQEALTALEAISSEPVEWAGQVVETTLEMGGQVLSAHIAPVVTDTEEFLGVVTALRDITREVAADVAKSEFISTVSHELRTPLTSIKGYTDLVYAEAVGSINEQQQRFLGIVRNNADRLTALISDLLDISRIDTGRVKLNMESLVLTDLVREVAESMRGQVESKGLRLELDLSEEVESIIGDRMRLGQIVTNLIGNACKYTDQGWVRVKVSSLGGAIRMDVADSGIGIAVEDQRKVFDRFYRVDTPLVEGRGGTGLGLAITKELVELHGGRVWVESELGVGSTFTVVLPSSTQELSSSILDKLPAGAKKILVVDDERDILALLRFQLGMQHYQVLTASTGEQAIAKAVEEQPDLITLDIVLPDRSGFSVLRELKARPETSHIPVIILSVVQDETSGYHLGAVDYVVKPIDKERLLQGISTVLDSKEKVLIAEDDSDTAAMLIELLHISGYVPLHAVNGYEVLALTRREHPGLILLDLRMPGMDGYEALTRLKEDPETRNIPILVMSAHAADSVQERLKVQSMGALDFFSKPLSMEELMVEIEQAISAGEPQRVEEK